jgi:hypothetical protein
MLITSTLTWNLSPTGVESLVYLFTPLISTLQNIPQIWHTDVQDRQIFAKLENNIANILRCANCMEKIQLVPTTLCWAVILSSQVSFQ